LSAASLSLNVPDQPRIDRPAPGAALSQKVGAQERRKLKARRASTRGVWSGFGMFGLIGWSVATPTLLGALLGLWLDKRRPGSHSWALSLLVAGLCLGCANAWHWVTKEDKAIRTGEEDDQ
jgi:ATP synthase protein I